MRRTKRATRRFVDMSSRCGGCDAAQPVPPSTLCEHCKAELDGSAVRCEVCSRMSDPATAERVDGCLTCSRCVWHFGHYGLSVAVEMESRAETAAAIARPS